MERALNNAIKIYPHIGFTCWDSDSDDTPESATEQLRDIINSLYQLAPYLNEQQKKLACIAPAGTYITMFGETLLLDGPEEDNTHSYLSDIELVTTEKIVRRLCGVTPTETTQPRSQLWTSDGNRPPRTVFDREIDNPGISGAAGQTPPKVGVRFFIERRIVGLIRSEKLLGGQVSWELSATIVESIWREAENSYVKRVQLVNCVPKSDHFGRSMWAKMQLDRICIFQTESEIRAQLEPTVLLSSLDDTYQQLWDAAGETECTSDIHDMLAWILFGLTPLSANAIFDAMIFHGGSMYDNLLPISGIHTLLRLCDGFVPTDLGLDALLVIHRTAGRFYQ